MARVEELKKISILDVAEALGMELKRQGTDRYVWVEHESFVISPRRNRFSWFSRDLRGGDALELVQTIREAQTGTRPSFKAAKHFLEAGHFPESETDSTPIPKIAFEYKLKQNEHVNTSWTRQYLRRERKLSPGTIDFFFQQGSIAEISHKMNDYSEPAIVFKFKNSQGKVMGASLQGIVENLEKYPDRGYLKRILKNSDGLTGFYADVGRPKRLIFAESPIDVMSYYQLHPQLQDVRLVAMDGLKEGLMSFRFAELVSDLQGKKYEPGERTAKVLEVTAQTSTFFQKKENEDFITLAVDNDSAGWNFISKLQEKGIPFKLDIPPIAQEGVEKADWNSFLKEPLQGQIELVHIYSYDKKKKSAAYQGYFSKDLAAEKIAQLTAGDMVAFSTSETLSRDEIEEFAANQSQTYQQLSEAKEGLREDVPQTLNIWAGTNENTLLSNLAPSLLVIDGFSYESVEHAYQTLKSGKMNAKAYSWAEKNRAAFKTGQKVQSDRVLGPADTSKNILLMEKLLKERYQQDTSFRQALDATRGKVLTHEQDQGIWKVEFPKILTRIRDKENFKKENRMTEVNKPSIDQLIQDRDLKGLSAHLKEGVKDYFNSDIYKAFLQTMSKFNNYSLNNLFLIVAQKKDASAVASFNAWKKLGRHVQKGQKALKIWAPYQVTRKDEKGQPVLDKKGQEVKDTRFRLVPVFDVSQTEGKELPQPIYELEGTHQDYANLYRAAKETAAAKGVRLEISKEQMEAHGYYSPSENKIVIRAGMSERETLSTIFHEMAHADLHNPKALEGQKLTRTNKELQAESVAYVVANHYGLDTSSYSFGYLANWSNEPDSLADLEAQLSIVQKEAADLIKRLDTAFEKYQNKEVSKDPLSQKLEEFNQKCQKKLAEKVASEPEKKSHPQKGDEEKDNQASK
ncbi:ArdC-like ssDNA-binding domain-containing protein [Streptococcus sp. IsoGale022]|uniref:ArdC-like ssDNA-binding domain-containing protein n=1 Tax=Streptococcus sp. IsoGale022 TaxID=2923524 RepID=UPI00280E1480|nr:ArdC-like ssDNA-binding domain-containing protein [Streptococcus sp. IsoGale022]MDQ8692336.1 ArdC-like ssDNA-binding domain-containing protein [Streptococcus sp. IsoGale022]